jgi:hypothetical protein
MDAPEVVEMALEATVADDIQEEKIEKYREKFSKPYYATER